MTNKEYKEKRDLITTYNGYDYLTRSETSELYHAIKSRVKSGACKVPDCNNKATYHTDKEGLLVLTSYYTDVLKVAFDHGAKITKLWDGYSHTTLRHVNNFLKMFGLQQFSKREWIELEAV